MLSTTPIVLPESVKSKCSHCGQSNSVILDLDDNVCEKCGAFLVVESSDVDEQEPRAKKSSRKPVKKISSGLETQVGRAPKSAEKTLTCEFDEETSTGEKGKHRYSFSFSDPYGMRQLIETKKFTSIKKFQLNLEALQIKNTGKIDRLISLDAIRTKLIPYNFQMQLALQVINEMNGNAILSDEVGLGKTIEAGLIMKEFLLREEINSILIVSPKSLLTQWKTEMAEKFAEAFLIANNPRDRVDLETDDRIICSHNLLVRKYDQLASRTWDLVVVDEAHAFRNSGSKGRICLANLRKNHLLLLTATPLCNKLTDVYSMVDLIQPGLLESERSFVSRFAQDAKCRVVRSDVAGELKRSLRSVMCRTRREQTGIPFTKRYVDSRSLEANDGEREFIDQATDYLRDISKNQYKTIEALMAENPSKKFSASQSNAILVFQAMALQQSFSSSPAASIESLKKRGQRFPF